MISTTVKDSSISGCPVIFLNEMIRILTLSAEETSYGVGNRLFQKWVLRNNQRSRIYLSPTNSVPENTICIVIA
jgi:hypothetical protein